MVSLIMEEIPGDKYQVDRTTLNKQQFIQVQLQRPTQVR